MADRALLVGVVAPSGSWIDARSFSEPKVGGVGPPTLKESIQPRSFSCGMRTSLPIRKAGNEPVLTSSYTLVSPRLSNLAVSVTVSSSFVSTPHVGRPLRPVKSRLPDTPEMTDRLASARLKLKRAVEHLEALDREVRGFADAEIERIWAERDPADTSPIQTVWLAMEPPPFKPTAQFRRELPHRFGVILGDFVGNLRAALDHAVNGIAEANAGDSTKFPIVRVEANYPDTAKGDLKGVPASIKKLIEGMQPYHGHARGDRLALLANLSNIDKHRVLYPARALVYNGAWNHPPGVTEAEHKFRDEGVLGDVAEIHITFAGPDRTPNVVGGAPYQLAFSDPNGNDHSIVATRVDLGVLLDEVRAIIAGIGGRPSTAEVAAAIEMPTI